MLSIIVATNKDGVIGVDNKMPWHLASDFKHFKNITMGKPVIMGKKTFESIGKPLPGRLNIVLTDNKADKAPAASPELAAGNPAFVYAYSLPEAVEIAKIASDESFIIGGAFVYAQALPLADRLYITEVSAKIPNGNKFFPEIDRKIWKEISREKGIKTAKDDYDFEFVIYERKNR